MSSLADLDTPCLILDRTRMERNVTRLAQRIAALGVGLRPHLKTAKSWEVGRRMLPSPTGPATVSTLREAEEFAAHGVRDLTYAVGIAPHKLERVARLRASGCDLSVILDSREQARAVAAASRACGQPIPALIEIDGDGHRAGVAPGDHEQLQALARVLTTGGAELRGVLTHAGGSYHAASAAALAAAAEQERAGAAAAATSLRTAGFACPVVSVGSTPTAHFARDLTGVTEVRAGVYVFFDLTMASLGVCQLDDIACSVLATVIGHQATKGWTLTDAGWMALSRDLGDGHSGYGQVCDLCAQPYAGYRVVECSQEHGVLASTASDTARSADPGAVVGSRPSGGVGGVDPATTGCACAAPALPVGARVRIFPNHACATAAQFDRYHVVGASDGEVEAVWPRFNYW